MRYAFIGILLGFSFAGNVYAWQLHSGGVVSVKAACAERVDYVTELQRGMK